MGNLYSSSGSTEMLLYSGDCIPDCISVVVLKNCKPGISYILAELFNMCLKESSFTDCWKASSMVPVFLRMLGKGLLLKTTA